MLRKTTIDPVGDAYDNAPAESTIGLFKTELINRRGPCKTIEQVEFATLEWVAYPARTELMRQDTRCPASSPAG
jgi:hypothetical protein